MQIDSFILIMFIDHSKIDISPTFHLPPPLLLVYVHLRFIYMFNFFCNNSIKELLTF